MSKWPVRRSQLIAPFGVGAMSILQDGVSVISCGLDHWYRREGLDDQGDLDEEEYQFHEWRLERILGVDHFRLPPDFRKRQKGDDSKNCNLTIPHLRFPEWHFCPGCHLLTRVSATHAGWCSCSQCELKAQKKVPLLQVPFVAMCKQGHIQDFPWREWVHSTPSPICMKPIRLIATGGASLASQVVSCGCGAKRTLFKITEHSEDGSYLSSHLSEDSPDYLCQGHMPWLGKQVYEKCGSALKGTLRSASNVYFAQVHSAVFIPRGKSQSVQELVDIFSLPSIQTWFGTLKQFNLSPDAEKLRIQFEGQVNGYLDSDIDEAIQETLNLKKIESYEQAVATDSPETAFRREEFEVLTKGKHEAQLVATSSSLGAYENWIRRFFDAIIVVDKLRETRVLSGFTRVFSDNGKTLEEKKCMLWRRAPLRSNEWLPGHIVFGEGILLVLREQELRKWEKQNSDILGKRLEGMNRNYDVICRARALNARHLTPRFLLLHTLSHVLMNRLTFECGYSSASIRERLYVSDDTKDPMSGVLIYTASGDSEGTLGGLVRMGKPGYFEPVLRRALETAQWCSADPVCMEQGERGGQGPDSCNLAACHNCALVPETACEEFNRFLDRGLLVGTTNADIGFFKEWW